MIGNLSPGPYGRSELRLANIAENVNDGAAGVKRGAATSGCCTTNVLDFFVRQFPGAGPAQYSVRHSLLLSMKRLSRKLIPKLKRNDSLFQWPSSFSPIY
jgi:hypothetical protein